MRNLQHLPVYLDRALYLTSQQRFSFDTEVGPHAATTRWSYTVPSNAAAVAEHLAIFTSRRAPASAGPTFVAAINIGGATVLHHRIGRNDVGYLDQSIAGSTIWLPSGVTVDAITEDASTGGSVWYRLVGIFSQLFLS